MKSLFLLGLLFVFNGGSEKRYARLELQADLSHIRHAVVVWTRSALLPDPSLRRFTVTRAAVVHEMSLVMYRTLIADKAPHDGLDPPC